MRSLRLAISGLMFACVLTTCSQVPMLPVVDGAVMEITRSTDSLHRSDPGFASTLQLYWFGTACHYIQLGEIGVLTDPFVTTGTPFLDTRSDPDLVERTLARIQPPPDAVLVNHSHHDHLLDAHTAMTLESWRAKRVPLYGGRSARNLLAGWSDAEVLDRTHVIDSSWTGRWQSVSLAPGETARGYRLRFKPYRTRHSPHLKCGKTFFEGHVREPLKKPPSRLSQYQAGEVFNFLVELKSPQATFRVYCHGAPYDLARLPESMPPAGTDIDVAILLAPSAENVDGYPADHLRRIRAPHLVLSHFDNFFKKDSEEILNLLNKDFVNMNGLLRDIQDAFTTDAFDYPEFRKLTVPALTRISGDGSARNVVRIPLE